MSSFNIAVALRYARMTGGDAQWALVELRRRQQKRFDRKVNAAVFESMYAHLLWS